MAEKVMVVGGAGYVGSSLVPSLIEKGYEVSVYDNYWYGEVFSDLRSERLTQIKGDIRDREKLVKACRGIDSIIHLACISNDPSFDLNPELGKSINRDAFFNIIDAIEENRIRRMIYASSSSVYGLREEPQVTEKSPTEPITDYAKYKLECEKILEQRAEGFEYVILRPATVCGYSRRLRLDLTVNILTINALESGIIKVFGGKQMRPNINIKDMVRAYEVMLEASEEKVNGRAFNVGYENHSVEDIAKIVAEIVPNTRIEFLPTNDNRSYRVNSDKIFDTLGFKPEFTIEDASRSIAEAHQRGLIIDGLNNPIYHNIKRMKEIVK